MNAQRSRIVLLTGGSTVGHVIAALAVWDALEGDTKDFWPIYVSERTESTNSHLTNLPSIGDRSR
jgi:UDP-N-acetylglucosamine:LPS N-acetylglucosamine transferase